MTRRKKKKKWCVVGLSDGSTVNTMGFIWKRRTNQRMKKNAGFSFTVVRHKEHDRQAGSIRAKVPQKAEKDIIQYGTVLYCTVSSSRLKNYGRLTWLAFER